MKRVTMLLAEDHPQMRQALLSLLRQDFDVLEAVEQGDQVLEAAERLHPDAILLDVSLPGRSGLRLLPELRAKLPGAVIVMLTAHDEAVYRSSALRLGADAFLSKSLGADLLGAIRSVLGGPQRNDSPSPPA